VRAHVLLCMLAGYFTWHLRRALGPLTFADTERVPQPERHDPVADAERSSSAKAKAGTKQTAAHEPVSSYQGLIEHLKTLAHSACCITGTGVTFDKPAEPTPPSAGCWSSSAHRSPCGSGRQSSKDNIDGYQGRCCPRWRKSGLKETESRRWFLARRCERRSERPRGETSQGDGRSILDEIGREGTRKTRPAALGAHWRPLSPRPLVSGTQTDTRSSRGTNWPGSDGFRPSPGRVRSAPQGCSTGGSRRRWEGEKPRRREAGKEAEVLIRNRPARNRPSPEESEVPPLVSLHGLSNGDFAPALQAVFDSSAGLSSVINRLGPSRQNATGCPWPVTTETSTPSTSRWTESA